MKRQMKKNWRSLPHKLGRPPNSDAKCREKRGNQWYQVSQFADIINGVRKELGEGTGGISREGQERPCRV